MVMELRQGRTCSNEKSGRETGGGMREEVGEERNRRSSAWKATRMSEVRGR